MGYLTSLPPIPLSSSISPPRPYSNHHLLLQLFHKPPFTYSSSSSLLKTQIRNQHKKFLLLANNRDSSSKDEDEVESSTTTTTKKEKEKEKERRSRLNVGWGDLLDPDPDNILALGLTGVLAWASVQVLWQLCFISLAILVAALKYSFVAALLLFILIALL